VTRIVRTDGKRGGEIPDLEREIGPGKK